MPVSSLPALPENVSPGELITADLINAILAALRGITSIDERSSSLAAEINTLKAQAKRLEDQIGALMTSGNDLRGRVDRVLIDRDDILAKISDLNISVIPGLRKRFDDIEAGITTRFDPIERRMTDVELRMVRNSDPIERVPGLTQEHIITLRNRGIVNVSDLVTRRAEIPAIIGNPLDAERIGNLIGRFG